MTLYEQHCAEHGVTDPETALWRVVVNTHRNYLSWGGDLNGCIVRLLRDEADHTPRMVLVFPVAGVSRWVSIDYLEPLQPTGDKPCEP